MSPRKHSELIHAFADGAEIECKDVTGVYRKDPQPLFLDDCEYRIKPAAPAYPETTMTGFDLLDAWQGGKDEIAKNMRLLVNAALRHAIDTGLVAPKEAYDEVCKEHREAKAELSQRRLERSSTRDLAVAEAVREAAFRAVRVYHASNGTQRVNGLDLHAIIAGVP